MHFPIVPIRPLLKSHLLTKVVSNTDSAEARPSCHFSIAADKDNETKKRRKTACSQ